MDDAADGYDLGGGLRSNSLSVSSGLFRACSSTLQGTATAHCDTRRKPPEQCFNRTMTSAGNGSLSISLVRSGCICTAQGSCHCMFWAAHHSSRATRRPHVPVWPSQRLHRPIDVGRCPRSALKSTGSSRDASRARLPGPEFTANDIEVVTRRFSTGKCIILDRAQSTTRPVGERQDAVLSDKQQAPRKDTN